MWGFAVFASSGSFDYGEATPLVAKPPAAAAASGAAGRGNGGAAAGVGAGGAKVAAKKPTAAALLPPKDRSLAEDGVRYGDIRDMFAALTTEALRPVLLDLVETAWIEVVVVSQSSRGNTRSETCVPAPGL